MIYLKSKVIVIFDHRERPELFAKLDKMGKEYQKEQLLEGDCLIKGPDYDMCRENKFISLSPYEFEDKDGKKRLVSNDFAESLFDGRLYTQSTARREKFNVSYMDIIILDRAAMVTEYFTKQHWISTEDTLEIEFRTIIKHHYSIEDYINHIYDVVIPIVERGFRTHEKKRKLPNKNLIKTNPQKYWFEAQIRFLEGLLDCGPKKAEALLERWGSPDHIIHKIEKFEDLQVKGIGEGFLKKNLKLLTKFGDEK